MRSSEIPQLISHAPFGRFGQGSPRRISSTSWRRGARRALRDALDVQPSGCHDPNYAKAWLPNGSPGLAQRISAETAMSYCRRARSARQRRRMLPGRKIALTTPEARLIKLRAIQGLTLVRSRSQTRSAAWSLVRTFWTSVPRATGWRVSGSRHLRISPWPSANESPPASLW